MRKALNDPTIKHLPPGLFWDANLPSFGVRVGKNRRTYIIKKSNRYITLGHYGVISLAEARNRAKQALFARYAAPASQYASTLAGEYLKAISAEKKPTTVATYSIYLRRLPNKQLNQLTAKVLYDALPKSRSAANLCFNVFKAFLSWCVERDHLDNNPLLKRRQPNRVKSRNRLLTDDEIRLIWKESTRHSDFGVLLRLLLLTGQRLNQIASLEGKWLLGQLLVFPAYIMKGNTEHIIPLTDRVRAELKDYTPPTNITAGRRNVQAAVPIPHWTPHDFRRYLSSTMAKLGIQQEVVERILAHKTGKLSPIAQVYNRHKYLDEMRSALERYENHLFSVLERT
jgi:integrase